MLKPKPKDGTILREPLPEGEVLKDKKKKGNPLWKTPKKLDETERYRKENLNE